MSKNNSPPPSSHSAKSNVKLQQQQEESASDVDSTQKTAPPSKIKPPIPSAKTKLFLEKGKKAEKPKSQKEPKVRSKEPNEPGRLQSAEKISVVSDTQPSKKYHGQGTQEYPDSLEPTDKEPQQTPGLPPSSAEPGSLLPQPETDGTSPIPPADVETELSAPVPAEFDAKVHGADTEELSDDNEVEEESSKSRTSRSASSSFLPQIMYMLRKNKRIRSLMIFNSVMSCLNAALMITVIILGIQLLLLQIKENPCLYEYSEWSSCSASCWDAANNYSLPVKYRTVIPDSVVRPRGHRHESCPPDLLQKVDTAPCNTYKCAVPLSQFSYRNECFYKNVTEGKKGNCYRIRNIPLDDILIKIDAELTQDCDDKDCPEEFEVV